MTTRKFFGSCRAILPSFHAVFVGLFFLTWVALTSAQLGLFAPGLALIAGLAAMLGFQVRQNPGRRPASPRVHGLDVAAILLAGATLWFTLPPSEQVAGGWDPGVYLHTAAQISRHGGLQFDHPDLLDTTPEDRGLLFRNLHGLAEPFGGMRLLPNGRVSPQFYHAYPSLKACLYRWGGIPSALRLNPLLNVASLLAFYTLAAGLFGRRWGLMAMVLLAASPVQLWQARFGTAEMLAQFFLCAGFSLLLFWQQSASRRWMDAALGGFALGLALLTRYDSVIVLAGAVPLFLWHAPDRRWRSGVAALLTVLGLAIFQSWAHQSWIAPYYRPLGPTVTRALTLCAWFSLAVLAWVSIPAGRRTLERLRVAALIAFSTAWSGWMLFNWTLRPTLPDRTRFLAHILRALEWMNLSGMSRTLTGGERRAMLFLQSILTPPGLLIALLGVIVLAWRWFGSPATLHDPEKTPTPDAASIGPVPKAWFCGGLATTLLLTWNPYNELFMMWVTRRYVPIVVPWLIVALVAVGVALTQRLRRYPRSRRWSGLGLLPPVLALAAMLIAARPLVRTPEWPGLTRWFESVAANIPDDAIVYTDQNGFGAALRFLWDRRAYELHHPRPARRAAFETLLHRAVQRESQVFVLTQTPPPETTVLNWIPVMEAPLRTHSLIQPRIRIRIPETTRPRGGNFTLYRLARPDKPPADVPVPE